MNPRRDFRPAEIEGGGTQDETAAAFAVARELEWYRDATDLAPLPGLIDQVMSAVAEEPRPAPLVAAAGAIRSRRLGATMGSLRDVWRVAWSGPRPLAVRATALAFVAFLLVGLGSVGGLAVVGAWNALSQDRAPLVSPSPEWPTPMPVAPTPSPSTEPSPSPSPTSTPTAEPSPTPTPHDGDHGGSSPSPAEAPTHTPTHAPTPVPGTTHHPEQTHTPDQSHSPEPTDSGHHDG